jgi:hypothetical protein
MIPTYVLNSSVDTVVMVVTRELDEERVEVMWIVARDPKRVGTCDWAFRSNMEDGKSWTRIA